MTETRILNTKPDQWDSIVFHPLQAWAWGDFRKKMGIEVVRVGIYENSTLIGGYQLTFHKSPKLPYTIGYFPKGPEPKDDMLLFLQKIGKEKKAIFIQLEPNVIPPNPSPIQLSSFLVKSHHPLFTKYTFSINLTKSEEQLLKDMHSKTRYNIKVAQKHEVKIEENSSDEAFKEYLLLSEETTRRQGFYAHTSLYHSKMWEILHKEKIAKLWRAVYKGQTLASWIIFCFGDTVYYPYGASSREHREVMAPTLLLWEITKWAKKAGFKKFDLWGAMGPNPDKNDPWYGFHRFKEGFNPEFIEFIGSYDLVVNPLLYKFYCLADTLRWKVLKAKR